MTGAVEVAGLPVATWRRLRTGAWGLAIAGEVRPGDAVRATRRDGSAEVHTVGRVLWSGTGPDGLPSALATDGGTVALDAGTDAAPAPSAPVYAPRSTRRRRGSRFYSAPAARGRCEDAPCCGCCDAGGGFSF